jgi:hypothetical protein
MHACPLVDEAILYNLRQMTPEEAHAYQAHLAECPACRLKLSEVSDTLDLLPLSAPPAAPPPNLRAKVLQRVAREAQLQAQGAPARRRWLLPAWAAAAACAAIMIGTYAVMRVEGLQQQFLGFRQAAPVERSISLVGTPNASGATGRVLVAREGSGMRLALEAQGLPSLQPGETYHLWLIKDGKRTCGGVFVVDGTGRGGLASWLPAEVEFDALGVTREPDALGQQPRGPKIMGSVT